jgi:ElaB/YqjD/DUF883 family membrane-anchored ribosome-binding protein
MSKIDLQALLRDMDSMVAASERLVEAVASDVSTDVTQARRKAEQSLQAARTHLDRGKLRALQRARAVARSARQQVQNEPWRAVSIAAGAGLLTGLLLRRR